MNDFFIDLAVSTLITLLRRLTMSKGSLDGSMAHVAYRKVFLKIFTLAWGVFGADQSFRDVVGLPPESDGEPIPV